MAKATVMTTVTKRLYGVIHRTMQKALTEETWQKPWSDEQLCKEIQKRGCYCSKTLARDVRIWASIPGSRERRLSNFAKQSKGK